MHVISKQCRECKITLPHKHYKFKFTPPVEAEVCSHCGYSTAYFHNNSQTVSHRCQKCNSICQMNVIQTKAHTPYTVYNYCQLCDLLNIMEVQL